MSKRNKHNGTVGRRAIAPAPVASLSVLIILALLAIGIGIYLKFFSHAATTCDLYASPTGSDTSSGAITAPLQTINKLDTVLAPGQTGCLMAGTYGDTSTHHMLYTNGTSTGQITIRNNPGDAAKVIGWVEIKGAYTTVSHLEIDGSNTFYPATGGNCTFTHPVSQGLVIAGAGDILEYNNFYQSDPTLRSNGIGVGWWGQPDNAIIRYNKIHDVGQCTQHDHLIYLSHGNNVQIYGNWMWGDSHGFGIIFYPAPTNARFYSNVIDTAGGGVNFGDTTTTTSGNQAWNNVAMNSVRVQGDTATLQAVFVTSPGLGASSTGNQVYTSDSYNNPDGISNINSSVTTSQLSVASMITSNPMFTNPANHNYTLQAGSPVAGYGLWDGSDPNFGTTAPPPSPGPTPPPPTSSPVPGDLNGDGQVNVLDLSYMLSKWATTDPAGDLDKSGTVGVGDLAILLSHWGQTGTLLGTSLPAPLPPSTGAQISGSPTSSLSSLFSNLSPGTTLCLHGGTYGQGNTSSADLTASGTATNPITITSCPGETAQIAQLIKVSGNYVRLSNLKIVRNSYYTDPRTPPCPGGSVGSVGIWLKGGSHVTLEHSEITGNTESGIFGGGPYNQVLANYVHDNGTSSDDHGIYYTSDNSLIANNLVTHNFNYGIQLGYTSAYNNTVANNDLASNGFGSSCGGSGVVTFSGTNNNLFVNNIAANNATAGYRTFDTNNSLSHDDSYNNPGGPAYGSWLGSAPLSGNPLFVSTTDFHLQGGSSMIGAGDPTYTPPSDYYGTVRSSADLGAVAH